VGRVTEPAKINAHGSPPKVIEEYFGLATDGGDAVSIAVMRSPAGWSEPAQTPEFDEYTLVLRGMLRVTGENETLDVPAGQAVLARAGERVRYSTPAAGGAEYVAVCIPAFSPDTVHREPDAEGAKLPPAEPRPGASSLDPARLELRPIGWVRSAAKEPVDSGWAGVISTIELEPAFHGAALGLETFSHAIVVTHLHLTPEDAALVRRPRDRWDMPEVGVLAQRARHRPNPLGITAVEVVTVTDAVVTVRGLDAVDGTPVLDLKPYYPAFDRVDAARVPAWVNRLMRDYFSDGDSR
jgi:tRNA-Thr(GGU) m(6)t(6)A37 methyltransferase TsaA